MGTPAAVTVGTTATQLATVYETQELYIENTGSAAVFVSNSSSVTTTDGIEIAAGASFTEDRFPLDGETWYGIVATGTQPVIVMVN